MIDLNSSTSLLIFILVGVFQAGGFYFVTRANANRMRAFEVKLTETREDMAWIRGYLAKNGGNGKKR
jgi:hypothetical protein